jgi:hypothetical protein
MWLLARVFGWKIGEELFRAGKSLFQKSQFIGMWKSNAHYNDHSVAQIATYIPSSGKYNYIISIETSLGALCLELNGDFHIEEGKLIEVGNNVETKFRTGVFLWDLDSERKINKEIVKPKSHEIVRLDDTSIILNLQSGETIKYSKVSDDYDLIYLNAFIESKFKALN